MHLSKLIISNYRSIKQLSLTFEKGKNVIVGKNNAGKSNIIKAIDLILGESSPTWQKSDNITANDFFNGDTAKPCNKF
jgi:predicted ATP-dependent endonuclease of OLD family